MKSFYLTALLCFFSLSSLAQPQSKCFKGSGVADSRIKSITIKMTQTSRDTSLELLLAHKDHPTKMLRQFLSCFAHEGQTLCLADCDQGGVILKKFSDKKLVLENLGFTTSTSCGEESPQAAEIVHVNSDDLGDPTVTLKRASFSECAQVSAP